MRRVFNVLFGRRLLLAMFGCLFLIGLAAIGYAAWGPRGCGPVGPALATPAMGQVSVCTYKWVEVNETQHNLFRNCKSGVWELVGGWDHERKFYMPVTDAGEWGKPRPTAPIQIPPPPAGFRKRHELPTGVIREGISNTDRYSSQGKEVGRDEVYESFGDPKLIDDSKKPYVSVIGGPNDVERKRLLGELKAGLGDKYRYWEGPADDWSFEPGFQKDGKPYVIYSQSADGQVLHRQDHLEKGVAGAIDAIRKAMPDYDAKRDPDLTKSAGPLDWLKSLLPAGMGDVPVKGIALGLGLAMIGLWMVKMKE